MTPQAIHYALKRLDSSYKKRCNILRLTTYYALQQKIANYDDQGKAIGYRAESGFAQDMPRTYGYLVKGKRCYGTQDWNAKVRTNAIGAMIGFAFLIVARFERNINGAVFYAWLEQE